MKKVYLIGAGPGDAGLLTLRALELIRRADVVIYDRLADESILNFVPETAEMIYVGKASGNHSMTQEAINRLLLERAVDDKIIVRLKGGDPFVFGRGGEEAIVLAEHGIDFEIVPGISSAIAVPAYAGIPVTHRGIATSFAVVTGHEMNDARSNIRREKLATGVDTLVFLMGVANIDKISARLIENGRAANTPAAVIRCGTRANQTVLVSTLERMADDVRRENIKPPAVIVVGNVVRLRDRLQWFENRPLFGKKIVVTRARAQASELSRKLSELGAQCIEVPAIEIVEPSDQFAALDRAIDHIADYDLLIFTSVNGVDHFFDRLTRKNLDARSIRAKIAAIGSATARELRSHGILADFIPQQFRAEGLIELLGDRVEGKRVLIARAEEARNILPDELRRLGATIDVAAAYRTISVVDETIELDGVDWITFTSSSTVKNFVAGFGVDALRKIRAAAIGPITADTLREFGVEPDVVASEYTIDGLIAALVERSVDDA